MSKTLPLSGVSMSRRRGRGMSLAAVLAALALAGCTDAPEWRELKPDAAGLRVSLPCRPDRQARSVPLAGSPVLLTLLVCKSGGLTFAVSHADLADPARVGPGLRQLKMAAQDNLSAAAATPVAGEKVPGETPQPEAGRWLLKGHLSDGRPEQATIAVFSRGTHVVQATVLGVDTNAALTKTFFDALRFVEGG